MNKAILPNKSEDEIVICAYCNKKFIQSSYDKLADYIVYQNSTPFCCIDCRNKYLEKSD